MRTFGTGCIQELWHRATLQDLREKPGTAGKQEQQGCKGGSVGVPCLRTALPEIGSQEKGLGFLLSQLEEGKVLCMFVVQF